MPDILKAPFPYFGGKSKITAEAWRRFGRVDNYVEPFFGSGAVLLGCPWPGHTETVNDADGLLCNLWRALRADPDAVARYADYPVSELDLHARHRWLVNARSRVTALLEDPDAYDARAAGWWVWGISQWIGSGWCQSPASVADVGDLRRKIPHVGDAGRGVHRAMHAHAGPRKSFGKLPMIGGTQSGGQIKGMGVHRENISTPDALLAYLRALSDRLRRVRVTCGDFARVLGPSVTWRHGTTAVFLDPPYDRGDRVDVYAVESDAASRAVAWAAENGDNPLLRIALCGYDLPQPGAGWQAYRWKAAGGYGSQGDGRGRENAAREVVWFSPHCVAATPMDALWSDEEAA